MLKNLDKKLFEGQDSGQNVKKYEGLAKKREFLINRPGCIQPCSAGREPHTTNPRAE